LTSRKTQPDPVVIYHISTDLQLLHGINSVWTVEESNGRKGPVMNSPHGYAVLSMPRKTTDNSDITTGRFTVSLSFTLKKASNEADKTHSSGLL